jgi:formylmethanofuran dehydrogenase subunit B
LGGINFLLMIRMATVNNKEETSVATNVTCTVCACLCDDLSITHREGRIIQAERACSLAEPWYLRQGTGPSNAAEVDGKSVPPGEAIHRAASILDRSKAPLIYGLSRSSTEGQRAAVRLADVLGATIDTTASLGHGPSVMAVQEEGESTCTLGEARNRADLVIFWGTNPAVSHPRHFERYSVDPIGEFLPGGRQDRTVVVIDIQPTETSAAADLFIQVEPGRDFEALWTLRMLLQGQAPLPGATTGIPPDVLSDLLDRMRRCKYGVVFFGFGLSRGRHGHSTVEALLKLVRELNQHTRFNVRRMRGSGDVTGADMVLAWQTGYPFSVNLARGYPRYNPGEYSALALLERREVDACLFVGSHGIQRYSQTARSFLREIPTIVLDSPGAEVPLQPTVRFTTAIYGIHAAGTAYRMDEVPLPLAAFLPSDLPTDARVLTEIQNRAQQMRAGRTKRPSVSLRPQ